MKTIKLPYKNEKNLIPIIKQYSSIVRYSYNRFLEGRTEKDVRNLTKLLNNTNLLNSWIIQCAIKEGKAIYTRLDNKKVVFGGKINLYDRIKNKISKVDYQLKRLNPVNIQGEELKQGNRLFKLDIIENNRIIFKLNKSNHIFLNLPKLRNNIKNELFKLQTLNEVKQNHKGYTYSIRFDLDYIYISFKEFMNENVKILKDNRYLGIDLNPDTIGISVLENDKILYTQEFSLKPIFNKLLSEKLSSKSNRMKYFQNKLKFETYEICKSIVLLAKHFCCKIVFIEDLYFKNSLSNRISNRKNKNLWKKNLFVNNLVKRLNIESIKTCLINPAYTSFIGNMKYDYTDAVNASIEIARRGFEYIIKKNNTKFYPVFLVKHQWKEMAIRYINWKEFFIVIKNAKLKYRVSLDKCLHKFKVFKQNSSSKSMILNYVFMNN
jgi:predicted transposase